MYIILNYEAFLADFKLLVLSTFRECIELTQSDIMLLKGSIDEGMSLGSAQVFIVFLLIAAFYIYLLLLVFQSN